MLAVRNEGRRESPEENCFVQRLDDPVPDGVISFESRFESGNLEMVARVEEFEYNLLLQNDINSKGHTQWFFFRVSNAQARTPYTFHIINFLKPDSLFNLGMMVTVYSEKQYAKHGIGWHHDGENIMYYPNGITREDSEAQYYSLTFSYTFKHKRDKVYFAYSYPYTYTQLSNYLYEMETDSYKSKFITKKMLCRSLAGNPCEYLTITNSRSPIPMSQKRGIFISSRVHPGETVGSYMMKGVLDFLTSDSYYAEMLRDQFIFKIIPMLNPDGVINGNYRCSLVGVDLNRRWKRPHKSIHPTIYNAKRLIKSFATTFNVDLVCDLHGHSRKSNIFMYGNNVKDDPTACRLFPFILSKVSPLVHFPYCKFSVTKSKEATLRVALFRELHIPCVYTLESSFLGADTVILTQGMLKGLHFTTDSLQDVGRELCLAVLIAFGREGCLPPLMGPPGVKRQKAQRSRVSLLADSLTQITKAAALVELQSDQKLLGLGDLDSSSGSESEPSLDSIEPPSDLQDSSPAVPLRSSSRLVLKLPGPVLPQTPKRTPKSRAKRCSECGLELGMGHVCPLRVTPAQDQGKTQVLVGVKTYYTVHGKRVHDQVTQTKVSFYFRYKLNKAKAAQLSLAHSLQPPTITVEPETPEPMKEFKSFSDLSAKEAAVRKSMDEGRPVQAALSQHMFPGSDDVFEEAKRVQAAGARQKKLHLSL